VLCDGFVGQMMEPLDLEERNVVPPAKPWAVRGTRDTRGNLVTSTFPEPDDMEAHVRKLTAKYRECEELEVRHDGYKLEDADVLLVGYGIASRLLRCVVDAARAQGIRAGLFRPITLWPFPSKALATVAARCSSVLVVELSAGQMVEDVRLTIEGEIPVQFYGRCGGNVPSVEEVCGQLTQQAVATA
jgi:pyruvate/2-oxoacid:ferredoxin oxidoreductase alpha subunit